MMTSWIMRREGVKLGNGYATGVKANICTWLLYKESFYVVEDVVIMKLLLEQVGFVWCES